MLMQGSDGHRAALVDASCARPAAEVVSGDVEVEGDAFEQRCLGGMGTCSLRDGRPGEAGVQRARIELPATFQRKGAINVAEKHPHGGSVASSDPVNRPGWKRRASSAGDRLDEPALFVPLEWLDLRDDTGGEPRFEPLRESQFERVALARDDDAPTAVGDRLHGVDQFLQGRFLRRNGLEVIDDQQIDRSH